MSTTKSLAWMAALAALLAGCKYTPRTLPDAGAASMDGGGSPVREGGAPAAAPGGDGAVAAGPDAPAPGRDAAAPTACNAPAALCSGSCVDPKTTAAHCGRCGNACPSGPNADPVCKDAACGLACNAGYGDCTTAPGCETLVAGADRNHCGACNQACEAYQTCGMGKCSPGYLGTLGWGGGVGVNAVAVSKDGSFYVSGVFSGTADLDPGPATLLHTAGGPLSSSFISRYDVSGGHLWSVVSEGVFVTDVAALPAGGVVVGGWFPGAAQFFRGPSPMAKTTKNENAEAFVFALGPDGKPLFLRTATLPYEGGFSQVRSVSVSTTGEILVGGIGDAGGLAQLISAPGPVFRGFLVMLTAFGDPLWHEKITATGALEIDAVDLASDGATWATGRLRGSADFDPGPGVENRSSPRDDDNGLFLWKLTAGARFGGAWTLGGAQSAGGWAVDAALDGAVYVAGDTHGPLDVDPGAGTTMLNVPATETSRFIVKLGPDGAYRWSHLYGGFSPMFDGELVATADGGLLLSGALATATNFNPAGNDVRRPAVGAGFVTKLAADGAYGWTVSLGSDDVRRVMVGTHERGAVVVGLYSGSGDFDPGRKVQTLTAQAYSGFLSRFAF
jgi:hypothetical protein